MKPFLISGLALCGLVLAISSCKKDNTSPPSDNAYYITYTDSLFVGSTIQFYGEGVRGATVQWSFGDSTQSTNTNPTHMYTQPGLYTVTLTVDNDAAHAVTAQLQIHNTYVKYVRQWHYGNYTWAKGTFYLDNEPLSFSSHSNATYSGSDTFLISVPNDSVLNINGATLYYKSTAGNVARFQSANADAWYDYTNNNLYLDSAFYADPGYYRYNSYQTHPL